MSWNGQGNMGPSPGGGLGGGLVANDMSGGMPGNAGNQPHATEYTLQGKAHFILFFLLLYNNGLVLTKYRRYALFANRMASTRAGPQCVGD